MNVKTNINTINLINELKKVASENKAPIWKCVAELMGKPMARWAEVNVDKLEKYAKDKATVIVPGKLLGNGEIKKSVTVTAFKFSMAAKRKIIDAGGHIISIPELIEKNPKGSGIILMK